MNWISVNDDLPPCGVPVLACTDVMPNSWDSAWHKPRIYLMERFMRPKSEKHYYWNEPNKGNQISDALISHWMPLPAPPCNT
jgi:hypothetical protein